jgi:hypothetical protein
VRKRTYLPCLNTIIINRPIISRTQFCCVGICFAISFIASCVRVSAYSYCGISEAFIHVPLYLMPLLINYLRRVVVECVASVNCSACLYSSVSYCT